MIQVIRTGATINVVTNADGSVVVLAPSGPEILVVLGSTPSPPPGESGQLDFSDPDNSGLIGR